MRKLFYLLFIFLPVLAIAQSPFNAGVYYTTTPTTGAPSSQGSRLRVDLTTQYIYQWNPTLVTWQRLGQGLDLFNSSSAPNYAPTGNMSWFVVNNLNQMFRYPGTGIVWDCMNCYEVTFDGDLFGDETSQVVIGLQGRPVSVTLPLPGQVLKWDGSEWAPAPDGGTTYTAGTGIDVTGTVITNTGDLSATNEIQTISYNVTTDELTLSLGGGTVDITEVNTDAQTLTWNGGTGELSISGGNSQNLDGRYLQAEVDGSITNEGALTVAAGTGTTSIINSNTSGSTGVTISVAGILSSSESGNTITLTATEIDGSITNEVLTISDGTDSEALGGQTLNVAASGIATVDYVPGSNTLTIGAVEVDGSVSNEGSLTVAAGTGTTSVINSNTSGQTGVTLTAAGILSISESGNVITLTGTEVDGSTTNEVQTITAGDGAGDNKTLDLSLSGGTVTLDPAGILTISRTGNTLTLTATEVDGSVTNEAWTITDGTNSELISNQSVTFAASGGAAVSYNPATNTLTINAGSSSGGDNWGTQVVQTDATLDGDGTSGDALKIAQQGAASGQVLAWNGSTWLPATVYYQTWKDDGTDATQQPSANFVSTADIAFTLTNDAGNTETEVTADIPNGAVDLAEIQNISSGVLLGRSTAGSGVTEQITVSTGLSISGGNLTATDASTTNEIQSLTAGDGAGDNKTLDLSLSGGTVTLDPAGILTISRSGNTLTLTATEVDGSTTNEALTVSDGTDSEALGGQTLTFAASGIASVDYVIATNTLTVSATEVDGSITNEGSLTVAAGTGTTSIINSNTSGQTGVTLTAAGALSISESGNVITLTATEVDGSVSNEGSLTVNAGSGTTSIISSNTSGSTDVTLTAAGILAISESGNTITLTATEVDGSTTNEVLTVSDGTDSEALGGQTLTFAGGGIATVDYVIATNTLTVTATEVDGSISNEGSLTVAAGTGTTSIINSNTSGQTGVTLTAAGALSISESGNVITLTATEVDGSVSNEGSLTVNAGSGTTSVISSNTSGSTDVTLSAGSGISISESGNTITIAATAGGSNYQLWRDDGSDATVQPNANFVSTADISFTLTNDGANSETEVTALILTNAVDYGQIQQVAASRLLGNATGSTANVAEISLGSGLSFVGSVLTPADASATNEVLTISDGTDSEALGGQTLTVSGSGIVTADYVTATNTLTITGTEVDGSVTNEGSLTVAAGTGTTSIINSNTSGQTGVTLTAAGALSISESGNVITLTATEVDGSVTNEGSLTVNAGSGTTSVISSNTSGSTDVTLTAAGILAISESGNTITLTATEVDGSISNEGSLTVAAGTGTTSIINSNTSGQTGVTLTAAGALSISESGNVITLTATEVDGSVSNEGSLTVNAGSGTTSVISSNTSGSTDVTLTAGSGISISETGNNITIAATGGGGGAPTDAQYLTLATNGTLSDERVLTAGANISTTDAGAGSTLTVAALDGSQTTSQFTADQDNFTPTNWSTRTNHFVSSDATMRAITGFGDLPDNTVRRIINTGSNFIYVPVLHPDSDSDQRVAGDADWLIKPNGGCLEMFYDAGNTVWRVLSNTFTKPTLATDEAGLFYSVNAASTNASDHQYLAFVGTNQIDEPTTGGLPVAWGFSTASSATGSANVYLPKNALEFSAFGAAHLAGFAGVYVPTLSTSAQRYEVIVSLTPNASTTVANVNNSVGFRYRDDLNGGEWVAYSRDNAGSETQLDCNIAVATNTMYWLGVYIDKARSEARFFINGSFVGRITANMPNNVVTGFRVNIIKSVGTTARILNCVSLGAYSVYLQGLGIESQALQSVWFLSRTPIKRTDPPPLRILKGLVKDVERKLLKRA